MSLTTLSTFHFRTQRLSLSATGSAYHLVVMSPESLTQTSNVPQISNPVLVTVVFGLASNSAAANAPELLLMTSFGDVQFPETVWFVGVAVKDPSLVSCETTEF